jgi:transcriptional regulator with PAS, ATPase and Fis domain
LKSDFSKKKNDTVTMSPPLIGNSHNIREIKELTAHVADTGLNVVITGESGVGKEIVAQNLYHNSPRRGNPFIKINCAALPEGLLESEMFGHEQGAFTGADRKKRGKFELADKGVLLLDEIGDMPLSLQAKLLHVLQSGEFSPLGSEKEVKSDVWIISATNHNLEEDIERERFREDLYYRLNIININIAPLRDRPDDIPLLTEYFLDKYSKQFKFKNTIKLTPELIQRLKDYRWPGNVRELQNVLKRMLVLGDCDRVFLDLSTSYEYRNGLKKHKGTIPINTAFEFEKGLNLGSDFLQNAESLSLKEIKKKALNRVEREVITYVLEKTGWNRSKATKILKVSYKTLLNKINELNIVPPSD